MKHAKTDSFEYSERKGILDRIRQAPSRHWKTKSLWSFKNDQKLYGSPWLDRKISEQDKFCSSLEDGSRDKEEVSNDGLSTCIQDMLSYSDYWKEKLKKKAENK